MRLVLVTACLCCATTAAATEAEDLALAWSLLDSGKTDEAIDAYTRVAKQYPASLDPWLGLSWANIVAARWVAAEEACQRALAIAPKDTFARARLALVKYATGRFGEARPLYEALLAENPSDRELTLGLGLTLVRLGETARGRALCASVAAVDGDTRPADCQRLDTTRPVRIAIGAYGTYLRDPAPWNVKDVKGATVTLGVEWPYRVGLWLGTSFVHSELRYGSSNYWSVTPILGLYLGRGRWTGTLSGGVLLSSSDTNNQTGVVTLGVGIQHDVFGGKLDLAVSAHSDLVTFQARPRFEVSLLSGRLRLSLGPDLLVLKSATSTVSSAILFSGQLGLTWAPRGDLELRLVGWGGPRRAFVEDEGLTMYTSDVRFIGGYRVGATYWPVPNVGLELEFRHDIGDETSGESRTFHRVGATLGIRTSF